MGQEEEWEEKKMGKPRSLEQREERWRDGTEFLPFLPSAVLVSAGEELPAHLTVALMSDHPPSPPHSPCPSLLRIDVLAR